MENKREAERISEYHRVNVPEGIHYFEVYKGMIYWLNPSIINSPGLVSGKVYTSVKEKKLCVSRAGVHFRYNFFYASNNN